MKLINRFITILSIIACCTLPNTLSAQEYRSLEEIKQNIESTKRRIDNYTAKIKEQEGILKDLKKDITEITTEINTQDEILKKLGEKEAQLSVNSELIKTQEETLAELEATLARLEEEVLGLSAYSEIERDNMLREIDDFAKSTFSSVESSKIDHYGLVLERYKAFLGEEKYEEYKAKLRRFNDYWRVYVDGYEAANSTYNEDKVKSVQYRIYDIFDKYEVDSSILTAQQFEELEQLDNLLTQLNISNN